MVACARKPPVETVNFHVWQPCNMRCRFCFGSFRDVRATVLPKGHLSRNDAVRVVSMLAEAGFQKITFSGGEPFLCPWLPELIVEANQAGMTTSVVTNGSLLTDDLLERLQDVLDWLVVSIDSACPDTLRATGRWNPGRAMGGLEYRALCHRVSRSGMLLKVNTVVTQENRHEDLRDLILDVEPLRWKVMQVLPIDGQNSATIGGLVVSDAEFWGFVERHQDVENFGIRLVAECNEQMIGSYAMVDPAGRFFDNTRGFYTYSDPILCRGVLEAMQGVTISRAKFLARGGLYDWSIESQAWEASQARI